MEMGGWAQLGATGGLIVLSLGLVELLKRRLNGVEVAKLEILVDQLTKALDRLDKAIANLQGGGPDGRTH